MVALPLAAQDASVTGTTVRVGGVMDLEGDARGLGQGMQRGIEAAFKGKSVKGRTVEFVVLNDFYNPKNTVEATQQLLTQGIFAMLGNVGTPTARVALPRLAEQKVPAIGFYSGASLLRPGVGEVLNFRASYAQEIAAVVEGALSAGVKPTQVCAFVQNDAFGMDGLAGLRAVLAKQPGTETVVAKLEQILAMPGDEPARNNVGPVGVYTRNTLGVRDGYKSLKAWEDSSGNRCRLVVTVGAYAPIANFAAYARTLKTEPWVFSAVSFTGADDLKADLKKQGVADGVIMTQVVPALDSPLPIVKDARDVLGKELGYVSLEGYMAGRMFLAILEKAESPLSRESFLKAARGHTFDLGGFTLDFTNDNQGSDFVLLTQLKGDEYEVITPRHLEPLFKP
jgi:ABC-type branched-subunit amino acid transport system substrate-binding protein